MEAQYDLVIIGGGPAGLTAALYAGRAGYSTLLLEKAGLGGQMQVIHLIDNYPGFPDGISGFELQEKMVGQVERFGAQVQYEQVEEVRKENEVFKIKTDSHTYTTLALLIASGARYKLLGIPGERNYTGKGVSYCAVCDGMFFKDKEIVVVGGGDTALSEALFLTKFAKKITIIHRRDRFRAVHYLVNEVTKNKKIDIIFNTIVTEIAETDDSNGMVGKVILENRESGEISEFPTKGVFVFIGLEPNSECLPASIKDDWGGVISNEHMHTDIEGCFVAGDVRSNAFRQIVTACGDGALAAEEAGKFIDRIKGNEYV